MESTSSPTEAMQFRNYLLELCASNLHPEEVVHLLDHIAIPETDLVSSVCQYLARNGVEHPRDFIRHKIAQDQQENPSAPLHHNYDW